MSLIGARTRALSLLCVTMTTTTRLSTLLQPVSGLADFVSLLLLRKGAEVDVLQDRKDVNSSLGKSMDLSL